MQIDSILKIDSSTFYYRLKLERRRTIIKTKRVRGKIAEKKGTKIRNVENSIMI